MNPPTPATVLMFIVLAVLAVAPFFAIELDQPFIFFLLIQLMILALAASGLNILLGYAGLPSFGHAALVGIGGYCAAIIAIEFDNINFIFISTWMQILVGGIVAVVISVGMGAISLRTRGIGFILITLALGQMLFYFCVSLEFLGGDDGTTIPRLTNPTGFNFYYTVLFLLILSLGFSAWIRQTKLGHALIGGAINEERMAALGFSLRRIRLFSFAISGAMCGVSGSLMVQHTAFISPASMAWNYSAELVAIVLLGGAGTIAGPILGAGIFVILEELLSDFTNHWRIIFGPLIIVIVLFARGGVAGWINEKPRG
jgi:branched-chain amino acid transport system permease protein